MPLVEAAYKLAPARSTATALLEEVTLVTFQVPPEVDLPFAYAHARQVAPFLLRVQYGWAIGGERMAFGEGGQKLVFSLFGQSWVIRESPSWQF